MLDLDDAQYRLLRFSCLDLSKNEMHQGGDSWLGLTAQCYVSCGG